MRDVRASTFRHISVWAVCKESHRSGNYDNLHYGSSDSAHCRRIHHCQYLALHSSCIQPYVLYYVSQQIKVLSQKTQINMAQGSCKEKQAT